MNKYICLLRGINVSGKNIIKMDALKLAFLELGFTQVETYIQSGNIVFATKINDQVELETMIAQKINEVFQLNIPILIISQLAINEVVIKNDFLSYPDTDLTKLHVTFVSQMPQTININGINEVKMENERFLISKNVIYLNCPNGYGNTKLTNTFFEKKLKVKCTTRNWNTVLKLNQIATEL